ncbi:dihydroxyacetone kinase subunit DhaL [Rhizomonospora bruguierae]|uniref:dihydroxyacetone kinase subunit DhaL n=1 Tax=Rhizomonospora bruguierae TaxID=1581705 RepID=UPI001BCF9E21|nr:dihydroxyacetone kinase subunit DhaL [Micromonospora sp. NBRC 107566]
MADTTDLTRSIVRVMAQTAIDNEEYFGELDSIVGDGDLGFSLARGFEVVAQELNTTEDEDPGAFLRRVAILITSRTGGTSGPIWGTAFLRAATVASAAARIDRPTVIAMLRAAIEGIKARGKADLGDKTLLDALQPGVDELERQFTRDASDVEAIRATARVMAQQAEATATLQARRGRASYAGPRSIGSPDPGAIVVAYMMRAVSESWK